jgi:hypothetical protein
MVPMPTAWIELPPNPFTVKGGIALSDLKLPHSGEMWQFAPESRMNGMDPMFEMGERLVVKAMGLIAPTGGSESVEFVLQSTDVWEGSLTAT